MTRYERPISIIPIIGFRHMLRSMLRFTGLLDIEIYNMLYSLYLANIDSVIYANGRADIIELSPSGFSSFLDVYARPYHTEVQMYKSMEGLTGNINRKAIIEDGKTALTKLNHVMTELEDRFEMAYGFPITDPRTTYQECWYRLTVRKTEPMTVLRPLSNALRPE